MNSVRKNLRFEINLPRKQKSEIGETVIMTLIILQGLLTSINTYTVCTHSYYGLERP